MVCCIVLHSVILVLVNCYSVKLTARVTVIFSGLKILAIAFIVVVGVITAIVHRCYPDELRQPFQPLEGHEPTASSVALALYGVMWAYDGWLVLCFLHVYIYHTSSKNSALLIIQHPLPND